MRPVTRPHRPLWRRLAATVLALAFVAGFWQANQPAVAAGREAVVETVNHYRVTRPDYMAQHGRWDVLEVPEDLQVNAIHAALLRTGEVLIIAGSGNRRENFEAGRFSSLLWDPATGQFRLLDTPNDLFCSGHAFLSSGNLLVAGGTEGYEVLPEDVTHAAGTITIRNEDPDTGTVRLAAGTGITAPSGVRFRLSEDVEVPPADKVLLGDGSAEVTASSTTTWVEAVEAGEGSVVDEPAQYAIDGLQGADADNIYAIAEALTLGRQEYRGANFSYEFDPDARAYVQVEAMAHKRWYPTLVGLPGGEVLSVSGLDGFGIVVGENEVYDPATRTWTERADLERYFATYPALFLTADNRLFYSGSTTGYGATDRGRTPGIWNLADNTFQPVEGLRDAEMTETSASVLLPPAQDQRFMLLGGGNYGDAEGATARTDLVDLREPEPRYRPGPDLPNPTRYPSAVILPDDTVLISGGAGDYRGRGNSDHLAAMIYDPASGDLHEAATPSVGRNYHSEALLLPDGRVVTLGSDPLFDQTGEGPGNFEQRIEIYSPPYLYRGDRPEVTGGPQTVERGTTVAFTSPDPGAIASARLVRPSAVTHSTDVEQRSIALGVQADDGAVSLTVPAEPGLVPPGWYMLFVTNHDGVPSVARWVEVPA